MKIKTYLPVVAGILLWSTSVLSQSVMTQTSENNYDKEMSQFKSDRLTGLKAPYGWTSVVGLYELKTDAATFGSGEEADFTFPASAPSQLGRIEKIGGDYFMTSLSASPVVVDGEPVLKPVKMNSDMSETGPTVANWGSLQWYVANRKERNFIRLRDTLSPYRDALTAIPSYPLNKDYIITAKFTKAPEGEVISYNTAINVRYEVPVMGWIDFEWGGAEHRLTALSGGSDSYYIIFADKTTGDETYGGGRFLYPKKEDADGKIVLDFNKAINPPCVFTPYATCPLPPSENHLSIAVKAGEKMLYLY